MTISISRINSKLSIIGSLESLQECSNCLEENAFSAAACDDRCDNQSQSILDMISDIGNDGLAYSGMVKRGKNFIRRTIFFSSNNQSILDPDCDR